MDGPHGLCRGDGALSTASRDWGSGRPEGPQSACARPPHPAPRSGPWSNPLKAHAPDQAESSRYEPLRIRNQNQPRFLSSPNAVPPRGGEQGQRWRGSWAPLGRRVGAIARRGPLSPQLGLCPRPQEVPKGRTWRRGHRRVGKAVVPAELSDEAGNGPGRPVCPVLEEPWPHIRESSRCRTGPRSQAHGRITASSPHAAAVRGKQPPLCHRLGDGWVSAGHLLTLFYV